MGKIRRHKLHKESSISSRVLAGWVVLVFAFSLAISQLYANTFAYANSGAITTPTVASASQQVRVLWQDEDGNPLAQDEIPQQSVVLELMKGGKSLEPRRLITIKDSQNWQTHLDEVIANPELYEVVENKSPRGFDAISDGLTLINKRKPPQIPEIELFVNQDVHANIIEFDRVFRYQILAYVPSDATAIEISDTLPDELHFVSSIEDIEHHAVAIDGIDHKAISASDGLSDPAVMARGENVKATAVIDGQTLRVRVGNIGSVMGMQRLRERTVRICFEAQLNEDIGELSQLTTQSIDDNGSIESAYSTHDGVINQASYTIEINNKGESKRGYTNIESNRVSFMPEDVNIATDVLWAAPNEEGLQQPIEWPEGLSELQVDLLKITTVLDRAGNPLISPLGLERTTVDVVDSITLSPNQSFGEFKTQPKLCNTRYEVVESASTGYTLHSDNKHTDHGQIVHTMVNVPELPGLELYVNHAESLNLDYFDDSFEYELMAYVPQSAQSITITNPLPAALELINTDNVSIYDMGSQVNNHRDSVTYEGTKIDANLAEVTENGFLFTLSDVSAYRGHWLKLVYQAHLREQAYNGVAACINERDRVGFVDDIDGTWANVINNGTLVSSRSHAGVPNQAHYSLVLLDNSVVEQSSNVVTLEPSVMATTVEQLFEHSWPQDVEQVQAELIYGNQSQTLVFSADAPRQLSQGFARLSGVHPQIKLKNSAGYESVVYGNESDGFTISSKARYFPVRFFKVNHEGLEIAGAILELTGGPDQLHETWRSSDEPKSLWLKAGRYSLNELVSPENYETLDDGLEFHIDETGTIVIDKTSSSSVKAHLEGKDRIMLSNEPIDPYIEAYVNADVHADIVEFDRSFIYDIVAYVPANASSVEIVDALPSSLEFVDDAQTIAQSVQLRTGNSHRAGSTSVASGETPAAHVSLKEQKLTLTLEDVASAQGKYIQLSARAKIKDSIRTLGALGALTTVTNNGGIISNLSLPSGNTASSHTGVANFARYSIGLIGSSGESYTQDLTSNLVTIIPEMANVVVSAQWVDADGQKVAWPSAAKVSVKLLGKNALPVQSAELTSEQDFTFTVPKLEGVNYKLAGLKVDEGPQDVHTAFKGNAQEGYRATLALPQASTASSVSIPISARVILEGERTSYSANDFELHLDGANVSVAATNDDDGYVDFGEFEYSAPGIYSYIITGVAGTDPRIAYDTQAHSALVHVTKDVSTNSLNAEIYYDGADELTLTHKKVPLPGAIVDLSSAVSLNTNSSDVLLSSLAGNFSFELFDSSGVVVGSATNNADGSISFPPLVFGEPGDYIYTMRQRPGADGLIGYDSSEHVFAVHVRSEIEDYRLVAEIDDYEGSAFINSYVGPQQLEVSLLDAASLDEAQNATDTTANKAATRSSKELTGAHLEISDSSGQIIKSWISSESPKTFELNSGYYTLSEKMAPGGYQTITQPVDFSIQDSGEVVLETDGLSNSNQVKTNGGRIQLLHSANPQVSVLRQTVSGEALAGSSLRITGEGSSYSWLSNGRPHTLTLKPGNYELSELAAPQNHGRLLSQAAFTLSPEGIITLAPNPAVGARLEASGSQLTLRTSATPHVSIMRVDSSGNALSGSRLELKAADGELIDTWTSSLHPYELILPIGTYHLEERVASADYQRMSGALNFKVNDDGTLSLLGMTGQGGSAWTSDNLINLEAHPLAKVELAGKVLLDEIGIVMLPQNRQFTFNLLDETGRILETVDNDEQGNFAFSELSFTKPGTYRYFIEQQWTSFASSGAGVAFDPHRATVDVEVKRAASSELVATLHFDSDDLVFENALDVHSDAQLSDHAAKLVFKTMLNAKDTTEPGIFTLRLQGSSANARGMSFEASNDATGNVEFDSIAFENPGLYEFELSELAGNKPNIGYDKSKYNITVRVSQANRSSNPEYVVECWATNSLGDDINPANIGFANVDRTPPEYVEQVPEGQEPLQNALVRVPSSEGPARPQAVTPVAQTGDATNGALMALLLIGGAALLLASQLVRRAKRQ